MPENIIKLHASRRLRGRVQDWYNNTPGIVAITWNQLKLELINIFKCRDDPLTKTKKMEARVWKVGEKFSSYFQDKLKLINKLDIAENMAIEYVIEGIPDFFLKCHARAGNYRTLVDLLDGLQRITKN